MSRVAYRTSDGEELDALERGLRISRTRAAVQRLRELRRQADEELAFAEDTLTDLYMAQRV